MCLLGCLCYGIENQTPEKPNLTGGSHESRMLGHLLAMENAQLAKLRETIERIEQMPPEEKEAMRMRLKQMNKMDPNKVDAMRERFKQIPQEDREAMRKHFTDMSFEERKALREKLRNMTPEERQAYADENGLPHPPHFKKGPKGGKGDRPAEGKPGKRPSPELEDVFAQ